jgi:hypothetical protein
MQPHDLLGVQPGSSSDEVKTAFRSYARRHHPDRGGERGALEAGIDAYRRLIGARPPAVHRHQVVFHRRARGLQRLGVAWSGRRKRRRRPARVVYRPPRTIRR